MFFFIIIINLPEIGKRKKEKQEKEAFLNLLRRKLVQVFTSSKEFCKKS